MNTTDVEQIAAEIESYVRGFLDADACVPKIKLEQWAREIRQRLQDNPARHRPYRPDHVSMGEPVEGCECHICHARRSIDANNKAESRW